LPATGAGKVFYPEFTCSPGWESLIIAHYLLTGMESSLSRISRYPGREISIEAIWVNYALNVHKINNMFK
jgi:hypothetical protein